MNVGIDRMAFYVPQYYINSVSFASTRDINENVLLRTVGQIKNSAISLNEDIVSMGINAGLQIVQEGECFDMCIFATETSFDYSKAASLYLSEHLNLNKDCICFEIKQACYASTAALICAINYVKCNKNAKVLVIASDIAKYEPNTNGELTNGAGAVAFIISNNPKLININNDFLSFHCNAYDFFKPNELEYPIVFGKESTSLYLKCFEELYINFHCNNFEYLIIHMPFPVIYNKICNLHDNLKKYLMYEKEIKFYSEQIGNSYSANLYINLCSLLDRSDNDLSDKQLLFFAYGSGATATMFSGRVNSGYKEYLRCNYHNNRIVNRICVDDYNHKLFSSLDNHYFIEKILNYQRFYKKL